MRQLHAMAQTGKIDYLEPCRPFWPFVHIDCPRETNPVLETLECDFEEVLFRLVGYSEQRHPFRGNLPADRKRRGIRFRTPVCQSFSYGCGIIAPFNLLL